MHFDVALNAIWLALGVFALASTVRARHLRTHQHAPAWLHVSGVALIIAALFPYISATDDVVRIQHMDLRQIESHHAVAQSHEADRSGSHQGDKKSSTETLIRLYEAMDTPVLGTASELVFTLFFLALVIAPLLLTVTREVTLRNGRSPPTAFA